MKISFKELIMKTNYEDVWKCIKNHHVDGRSDLINTENELYWKFKKLYKQLINIEPKKNEDNMYIYIRAFKTSQNDETFIVDLNIDDIDVYYDVSGEDEKHIDYSLVGNSFKEWLGFYIGEKTLKKMLKQNIICHCLWEMTFFGFDRFD